MPELEEFNTPTTRVYEDLLTAVFDKDIDTELIFDEAYHFILNDNINVHAIAPVEQDDNLNNMSIICNAEVFDTTFAVLADAEKDELRSICNETIYDLSADVIVLGHHGSSTSIYKPYLDSVGADIAVISCGKGNSYGHPHKEALDYINANAMTSLRTDEMGDIVFKVTADGYSLVE
jgi:beta-lactamase superfamily II metal-dependent hydrolase